MYNPTAGQRDRRAAMSALIDRMREEGIELVNAPTSGPGDATQMARAFAARGAEVVAVCGGDGTVSEAACGLAGSAVPIAILPGGTSNVLARELGIPLDLGGASALLKTGTPRALRLLAANGRPFLLWAGVGFDARIMRNVRPLWKRRFGRAGIFARGVAEYARYEFPRLEAAVDGVAYGATFAVVCHARRYAGEWIIAPEASVEGASMDVMLFSGTSRRQLLGLFRHLQRRAGGHLRRPEVRIVRGLEVKIRSLEPYAVEAHVDGDAVLETPITCRALRETVAILTPP
ncbi:MAG TPA: diacylglycerol kinase family protein [Thermoanaerobaculia bacterium]|nr:diacylglycerol kinase family protein [Thermoanaerobaculia bacterium]